VIVAQPALRAAQRAHVARERGGPGSDEPQLVPQRFRHLAPLVEIRRPVAGLRARERLARPPVRGFQPRSQGVERVVFRPPARRTPFRLAQPIDYLPPRVSARHSTEQLRLLREQLAPDSREHVLAEERRPLSPQHRECLDRRVGVAEARQRSVYRAEALCTLRQTPTVVFIHDEQNRARFLHARSCFVNRLFVRRRVRRDRLECFPQLLACRALELATRRSARTELERHGPAACIGRARRTGLAFSDCMATGKTGLSAIPAFDENHALHVVVESPRGSTSKFKYDSELGVMTLSRPLADGLAYPHDWGFVPSTRAQDGDPLDAMVLWDGVSYPGVVLACRAIGVLEVEQKNKESGRRERNDRLAVLPVDAPHYDNIRSVTDLARRVRLDLEHFFRAAVAFEDKDLKILGWKGPSAALNLVRRVARTSRRRRS
jgi:inorganic pyrophosphatase